MFARATAALSGRRGAGRPAHPAARRPARHGFQPIEGGTLYDAIRDDDPPPLRQIIKPTCFANPHIVPGKLALMEFEHDTPRRSAVLHRPDVAAVAEVLLGVQDAAFDWIDDCRDHWRTALAGACGRA